LLPAGVLLGSRRELLPESTLEDRRPSPGIWRGGRRGAGSTASGGLRHQPQG
jgi:hypothetical protein